MSGYQDWKEQEYLVTSLSLDSLNPRLPEIDKKLSQKELIEELIKHEDVYEIAKSVSENGYYPVERLICINENGKKTVVEGNRRLAALKLLLSPECAPVKEQKKYKKLSESISLDQIKKVKVTIAPDRKSANHYIRNKHTSPTVKSWKPIQQANFYKNLINSGITIGNIVKEYAIPMSEIRDFLQLLDMYNIACNLELPEKLKEAVLDTRNFQASTLKRVYQNQRIQSFLGINFDANKKLIGKIKKEEFEKGYKKLVTDIVDGKIDSRILNDNKGVEKYLKDISDFKPDTKSGSFHIDDLVDDEKKPRIVNEDIQKQVKKTTSKLSTLIPKDIKCTVDNEKIKSIFKELRNLKVSGYVNSVSILLRVLLEMSLAHYLDTSGTIKEIQEKRKKNNPGNHHPNYYPTLSEMLKYVLHDDVKISTLNTQARKALTMLVDARDNIYSKDFLDLFVHNKFVMPSESQLRTFWEQLEPIFKVTLVENTEE
jgi:hypothetical protein